MTEPSEPPEVRRAESCMDCQSSEAQDRADEEDPGFFGRSVSFMFDIQEGKDPS